MKISPFELSFPQQIYIMKTGTITIRGKDRISFSILKLKSMLISGYGLVRLVRDYLILVQTQMENHQQDLKRIS